MENGAWRLALGGARTLGKLDESSTGARLSAQMLGGQVKMHIGVIGMQSLAYDALFSLCFCVCFCVCFCFCFCFCFCVCVRVQPCSLLSLFLLREWKTAQTEES